MSSRCRLQVALADNLRQVCGWLQRVGAYPKGCSRDSLQTWLEEGRVGDVYQLLFCQVRGALFGVRSVAAYAAALHTVMATAGLRAAAWHLCIA